MIWEKDLVDGIVVIGVFLAIVKNLSGGKPRARRTCAFLFFAFREFVICSRLSFWKQIGISRFHGHSTYDKPRKMDLDFGIYFSECRDQHRFSGLPYLDHLSNFAQSLLSFQSRASAV